MQRRLLYKTTVLKNIFLSVSAYGRSAIMVIKRDFVYSPNGENRKLHIYLPDDYDMTDERYPVMYFFDGHNLFCDADATYGTSWGLKEFLDHWQKKMIVVGIECSHTGDERLHEYLPYPAGNTPLWDVGFPR